MELDAFSKLNRTATRVRLLEGFSARSNSTSRTICVIAPPAVALILTVALFGGLDSFRFPPIYVIAPVRSPDRWQVLRRSKLTVISLRNSRNLDKCSRTVLLHNGSLPNDKLPKTDSVSQFDCGAHVRIEAARKANVEEHN